MTVTLEIKVIPRSRRQLLRTDVRYDLRCYVNSAPEDNKANSEVIEFLAQLLKIAKSAITITAGATSRIKGLSIEGFSTKQSVIDRLGLEVQRGLF